VQNLSARCQADIVVPLGIAGPIWVVSSYLKMEIRVKPLPDNCPFRKYRRWPSDSVVLVLNLKMEEMEKGQKLSPKGRVPVMLPAKTGHLI
jgi:hypothetical protein